MPISQDRFLAVIAGAKLILEKQQNIASTISENMEIDMTTINSVIARTTDDNARAILHSLLNRFSIINQLLNQTTPIATQLTAIVMAEEIHFRKAHKRNERSAQLRRYERQRNGIKPKAPEVELPRPSFLSEQISTPTSRPETKDFENTPEYRAFKQQMAKLHAELPQSPLTPDTIVIFDEAAPISEEAYANLKIPSEAGGGAAMAEPIASPSSIKNSPAMAETSPIDSTIVPKQHKDGITRYLPMAEDDNGPEISSETNLL